MSLLKIVILALIQGLAELLPVSSSAHVVVAEHFMGIDPSAPEATLILVTLHTGTMLAVILYYWKRWKAAIVPSRTAAWDKARLLVLATVFTAVAGLGCKLLVEKTLLRGQPKAEFEQLFGNLHLVAVALGAAGILILVAGLRRKDQPGKGDVQPWDAVWIGLVQGLCLPFRGFSRSGATISVGLLRQVAKERAEEFSFALAVLLTPPILWRELGRFQEARALAPLNGPCSMLLPCLIGLGCSFIAGLAALKWLSGWLEAGRWYLFGIYCLSASAAVLILNASVIWH